MKPTGWAVDMQAPGGPAILNIGSFDSYPPEEIDARFQFGDVVAERPTRALADYVNAFLPDAGKVGAK